MAIDKNYEDNIILKRDAFQNLLTNIKNYPIIDINTVSATEKDELHGDLILKNYTKNVPCLKLVYGNEESIKGNYIFATQEQRDRIQQTKYKIANLISQKNNITSPKAYLEIIYNKNNEIYKNKLNQVQRFKEQFETISQDKLELLKACWNIFF